MSLQPDPSLHPVAGLCTACPQLKQLDLTACDLEKEGALAIIGALDGNTALASLKMGYNPALDEPVKAAIRAAAQKRDEAAPLLVEV